jgi:hypothetical protein
MSSSALLQVKDAASCILFVDALRAHLLKHDTIFWYLATFGTEAEKAAAAKRMARAIKLAAKIEIEIDAWLAPPLQDARPQPMRLDMDGAEAASPPPAAAVPSPSALKMPPTAHKRPGFGRICCFRPHHQSGPRGAHRGPARVLLGPRPARGASLGPRRSLRPAGAQEHAVCAPETRIRADLPIWTLTVSRGQRGPTEALPACSWALDRPEARLWAPGARCVRRGPKSTRSTRLRPGFGRIC